MYENLVFYQLSNEDSNRVLQLVEKFNTQRIEKNGVYGISLATQLRPYYILWRIFSDHSFIPIRTLAITFELSVERAFALLGNCNIRLEIVNSMFFESYYSKNDGIIPFGKYNGKRLAEILYIEPSYILWLANRFTPDSQRYEWLRDEARHYATVYYELTIKQRKQATISEFVGEKGTKLTNLYLTVLNVKLQTDSYKPDFYVDQNVLACDEKGNRFTFFIKAGGRSITPNQLCCHSRVISRQETLHLLSAKVLRHYEYNNVKYTHLGWVKLE